MNNLYYINQFQQVTDHLFFILLLYMKSVHLHLIRKKGENNPSSPFNQLEETAGKEFQTSFPSSSLSAEFFIE